MTSFYPQTRESYMMSSSAKAFLPEGRKSTEESVFTTRSNTPDSMENSPYDSENDREWAHTPSKVQRYQNDDCCGNSVESPDTANFEIEYDYFLFLLYL
jgi:hypothetical protein